MELIKTQEQYNFKYGDFLVTLRIIAPSEPRGVWSGNKKEIREWLIFRKAAGETPTNQEIAVFENMFNKMHGSKERK
jgi:hypothetical protein